jgi:membrane protein
MPTPHHSAGSPWHLSWPVWRSVAIRTWQEASDDNIGLAAAGVAFYGFIALVPMLSATVLTYGIFAEPGTVVRHMQALTSVMPADVARSIGEQLMTVVEGSDSRKGLGVLLAIAIALFGARNGAGALITALNIAYDEKEKRGFLRLTLVALAMTAAAVVVAVIAALAVAAVTALTNLLAFANDALLLFGTVVTYTLLTLAGAAGAAALYRFAPSRDSGWKWISPGSVLAGLLWLALTLGFGAYVARIAHYDATYGSLGAVIALLSWLYLSSYVLLFGAELNAELEHQAAPAMPGEEESAAPDRAAAAPDAVPPAATIIHRPSTYAGVPVQVDNPDLMTARLSATAARAAGLPRIGWAISALAMLGLSLLRRRGRAGVGLSIVAAAAGASWLRRR